MRLGVLASHPIQYQAPLYRALARRLDLHVYFAHRQTPEGQAAAGYGVAFEWDVDLLGGYAHTFLPNRARTPSTNRFFGCDTPSIREHIRSGAFDAFLVTGWNLRSYWQAVRACRSAGVPVLVRGDSHLLTPRSRLKEEVKEALYPHLLRQFDGFLVVGERARDYLLHYGARSDRLFSAPHFVDNDAFARRAAAARPDRDRLRASFGASGDDTVLLYVGRFMPMKRLADLLHAAKRMQDGGLPVVVALVGAGPLEAELRSLTEALNVRTRFAGFKNQSELPAWYAAADVFVLPSESETWGLAVNEAMACGCPAVVSKAVGCAPDLIEPGSTGDSFPVGDVSALADAIRRFAPLASSEPVRLALRAKMQAYSVEAATNGVEAAILATSIRIRTAVPRPPHA